MKAFRSYVMFFLILQSWTTRALFFGFLEDQNPKWMVTIIKKTPTVTISGVGYVIKVNDQKYVRTASHITLGSEDILIKDSEGKNIAILPDNGLIDNDSDDQLIALAPNNDIQALATYSSKSNELLVTEELTNSILNHKRKKILGPYWKYPHFTIVPMGHDLNNSLDTRKGNLNGEPQDSLTGLTTTYSVAVEKGESGSPIFSQTFIYRHFTKSKKPILVLNGHILNFNRYFHNSHGLSKKRALKSLHLLSKGKRGRTSQTFWKYENGNFSREINNNHNIIREIPILQMKSGDGLRADGGDGLKADGGDLTTMSSPKINSFGMDYNGNHVIGFRVNPPLNQSVIYPSWENYIALIESHVSFSHLDSEFDQIHELVLEKFHNSLDNIATIGDTCIVDEILLSEKRLVVLLKGKKIIDHLLQSNSELTIIKSDQLIIDYRGLFSEDYIDYKYPLIRKPSRFYRGDPYIDINIPKQSYQSRIPCKLLSVGGRSSSGAFFNFTLKKRKQLLGF